MVRSLLSVGSFRVLSRTGQGATVMATTVRMTGMPREGVGRARFWPGALAAAAADGLALHPGMAAPVAAAESLAALRVAVRVGPRAVVGADRPSVTLHPGQSATVTVTVKARMAATDALAVALDAPLPSGALSADGRALVAYRWADRTGRLTDGAVLGTVTRSGVHVVPLTLTLAAAAPEPVTLPLTLRAETAGSTAAAVSTRIVP